MPEDTYEDIRQRLFEAAWDAPAFAPAPERTVGRARRRAATTIGGAALAVVVAIVVAASTLSFDRADPNIGVPRQGDDREFLIDIATGETTEITNNPTFDRLWWPTVSPDGRRIAFTTDTTGSPQVYVADLDGSNVRQLTSGFADALHVAWSPTGDRIAFVALDPDFSATRNLYVVDVETGHVRRVTRETKDPLSPAWSPDGRSILYTVLIPGESSIEVEGVYTPTVTSGQLRVVDVETREIRAVFGGPKVGAGDAIWTSKGIVVVRGRDLSPDGPRRDDLVRLPGDGGPADHLVDVPAYAWGLTVSPDGSTIAYAQDTDDGHRVILYDMASGRTQAVGRGDVVTWVDADTLLVQDRSIDA